MAVAVGEMLPAKLLRVDFEARSPSSEVEVGRVEEGARWDVEWIVRIVGGSGKGVTGIERSGIYRTMAKSSGQEASRNQNAVMEKETIIASWSRPAHGRSPTHSRLQRLGSSKLTSFMLSPILSPIAVTVSFLAGARCRCPLFA